MSSRDDFCTIEYSIETARNRLSFSCHALPDFSFFLVKTLHILHLEDDETDAELTSYALDEAGLQCDWSRVDTWPDFSRALECGGFDLILADYVLPTFDGEEALALARRVCPDVPFLFVSGALGEERAVETLKNGATDYILKNRMERLPIAIERALSESQARIEREKAQASLGFLASASTALGSSLDPETTLATLLELVVPFLCDFCLIDVINGENLLQLEAVSHAQSERVAQLRDDFPPDGTHLSNALRLAGAGESLLVEEITDDWLRRVARSDAHLNAIRALDSGSYMVVPLQARGRTLGTMTFTTLTTDQPTPNAGRRYDAHDLALAQNIAGRAAMAIDNARLFRETQDALRARDEFLATLSHELRTPLNAMLGWTQMLRAGNLDAETSALALEVIERNTQTQARLIEDLLEVSRVITGKLRLDVRPVQLGKTVSDALESVFLAAEAKGLAIEYSILSDCAVAGDAHRLQQVVWNLLSNAIKFTPKGGKIEIILDCVDSHASLTVSDDGQGIAPAFLPHVFERFRQADSSSTRSVGGLGLGLGIVRQLVELHGGTVRADSDGEDKGARFSVCLPLLAVQIAPEETVKKTSQPAQIAISNAALRDESLEGARVLVVDDQADARLLVSAVLEGCGARVTTAFSARDALQKLGESRFDVLVSDVGMTGQDGYQLIRQVRALEGPAAQIPAMALTAYARDSDRERALSCGFQAHGVKPIEPKHLAEIVAQLFGKKETTRVETFAPSD